MATKVDIEEQAKMFLRQMEFKNICCDKDDCLIDVAFDDDTGDLECDMINHGYIVTVQRFSDTHPSKLWHSVGVAKHTPIEIEFWDKVAELYQDVPFWMFQYVLPDNNNCVCDMSVLIAQGCQCGGN